MMKHAALKGTGLFTLIAVASVWSGTARASDVQPRREGIPPRPAAAEPGEASSGIDSWTAVDTERLDETRGGFDTGNGMLVSFGIDRVVSINGEVVAHTSVNIPDVAHITPQQASALASAAGTVNVISNGPGNSFDPAAFNQMLGGTIIQNTLDNQQIQSTTTLDVGVNNLDMFRNMNLQDTLQGALIRSR